MTRYDLGELNDNCGDPCMVESEDGGYVKFKDIEPMLRSYHEMHNHLTWISAINKGADEELVKIIERAEEADA